MSVTVRPGSTTANAIIARQQQAASVWPVTRTEWYVQRVTYRNFSDADTSQALSLNVAFPTHTFPADVFLTMGPLPYIDLVQTFGGGTINAATLILGITGDTNGLVESQNVFTGQTLGKRASNPGTLLAAATLYQSAMAPLLQLDTTAGNINTLTSGVVDVWIPFSFGPNSRPV